MQEHTTRDPAELVDGYLPRTTVGGTHELELLLRYWFEHSDQLTIGDPSRYGGAPHVTVAIADAFALNRDTTRAAVDEFLKASQVAGGAEHLPWYVIENRTGNINKVTHLYDREPPPGWFAYLPTPAQEERRLR